MAKEGGRAEEQGDGAPPVWAMETAEVADALHVEVSGGLSNAGVEAARDAHGFNELEKEEGKPLWKLVLEQFDDTLVKLLLLAATVSLLLAMFGAEEDEDEGLRAYIEPFVILLILVLNAVVGVWQESNAENAIEALKELQSEHARVLRNGKWMEHLPARELVPGDIVDLNVGDKVPADIRLLTLKTATMRAIQSSLTGESEPVNKSQEAVEDADCEIQAKTCMLFAGTAIANGHCHGIVTAIGMKTEIGQIQAQITEAAGEDDDTPLKKKLDAFGELLAQVIFYICVLVWVINYENFIEWETAEGSWLPDPASIKFSTARCIYYFKIAVALAVAAIPEGLPAVITTCLALGTRKMAKANAIVRRLPSVETLGCTTVICSDKTGTLTTNQMSCVEAVVLGTGGRDHQVLKVSGHTYDPDGGSVEGLQSPMPRNLEALATICAVCNDSKVVYTKGQYTAVGAPTEAALAVLVEKLGLPDSAEAEALARARRAEPAGNELGCCRHLTDRNHVVATLEFDRDRKSMSVLSAASEAPHNYNTRRSSRSAGGAGNSLLVKGAAECVIDRCSQVMLADGTTLKMDAKCKVALLEKVESMAGRALRCLAVAQKTSDLGPLATYNGDHKHAGQRLLDDQSSYSSIESSLTLVGLVGLQDPPRPEVAKSIVDCKKAGIRVMMITGDNKLTGEAIASRIGILDDFPPPAGTSFTGREFAQMSHEKQIEVLSGTGGRVFSRAEPKHKQDIVRLLKELGEVTAMTGDGVNDAPALKLADIGVAMGISGTEVAKEASDMVLADDNFSTIVEAVGEGRAIYNNMKAFIRYMISSNIGEVCSIFFTAALNLPEALIPVQLLWVNLVTDGPPATALGFNPRDPDIMEKPPRDADDQLVTRWGFFRYMVVGIYVGFSTVGIFCVWFLFDNFAGIDLSQDGHRTISWEQLTSWHDCNQWKDFPATGSFTAGGRTVSWDEPCEYFEEGKVKASTMSLTVLVFIEMFNALNALSEEHSLLVVPPWRNPWLLIAMCLSFALHLLIMYVPFLADIFSIVPLDRNEWLLVLLFSAPVVLIEEVLKIAGWIFFNTSTEYARTH
mmetsp:Transcript_20925/g.53619  ORF Transcript_20925/g.53619 Transcript_20925/m.53619 type:complete len:1079 (+) Transcript_20925:201-3437(+)